MFQNFYNLLFHLIQYSSKFCKVEKEIVFLQAATHWEAFGLHTPTMAVKAPLCVTDVDLSHRWAWIACSVLHLDFHCQEQVDLLSLNNWCGFMISTQS